MWIANVNSQCWLALMFCQVPGVYRGTSGLKYYIDDTECSPRLVMVGFSLQSSREVYTIDGVREQFDFLTRWVNFFERSFYFAQPNLLRYFCICRESEMREFGVSVAIQDLWEDS